MALPEQLKNPYNIRVNNPTLNRNVAKFSLHHIWDSTLDLMKSNCSLDES